MVSFVRAMVHLISWFLILFFFFKIYICRKEAALRQREVSLGTTCHWSIYEFESRVVFNFLFLMFSRNINLLVHYLSFFYYLFSLFWLTVSIKFADFI